MPDSKNNPYLFELPAPDGPDVADSATPYGAKSAKPLADLPPNLAKAVALPVPDFADPERKPTCLEIDFPIAPINALSNLEGNAGKPIYQMSKWWARRRSSVFRSLLIAAATEAPDDPEEAAKLVWENYYANHQKKGAFSHLRVLDIFMGGGTTLVEGARLGFQMTGNDLNPVAWFVCKNELACSDPEQVAALFSCIEAEVKPLVQPFYTTTCPRDHTGRWYRVPPPLAAGDGTPVSDSGDSAAGGILGNPMPADFTPADLPPAERRHYRWEGPEVIYTFWAKHGPCKGIGCGHRTPVFQSPVVAEKNLSTEYLPLTCPACAAVFQAEFGQTRMAPGVERVVLDSEPAFTELTQPFAKALNDYNQGGGAEKRERALRLLETVASEPGLRCPQCGQFAGQPVLDTLKLHANAKKVGTIQKKHFKARKTTVDMTLLIHPDWLAGCSGVDDTGRELGGYADADADATAAWYQARLDNLCLVEVRGKSLPDTVTLADGSQMPTKAGTMPRGAHMTCARCGLQQALFESYGESGHDGPVAAYALQCHCPQCAEEGYTYNGRYFKAPDAADIANLAAAEREWAARAEADLAAFWPREEIPFGHMTHQRQPLPQHGYTRWHHMFNHRQLLVHSQLLRTITRAAEAWPLDVCEQALGAFQQYLRNQNMFCFWDLGYDKLVPMLSNANYHPKALCIENCTFHNFGRGNLDSVRGTVASGLIWANDPWEPFLASEATGKSEKMFLKDSLPGTGDIYCGSSTDLSMLGDGSFDLVVTDPPFGNNLYYADLADFFYVWLRLPLVNWYEGLPERAYFLPERTPHGVEAIDNPAEHPDDRAPHEKERFLTGKILAEVHRLAGDETLAVNQPNPLFRPEPSGDFYCQTLAACWAEAHRLLKPAGLLAFTFHHSEDEPWLDVLESLFHAGYILVATYPIRSDEMKGEKSQFGSKKIEYDIIHVCRKRLEQPAPVSYARMRRWVKEETGRLQTMLEHTHGGELPESDLRVILRGKALEFYSRHYGQVYTGSQEVLGVRDALLGINQLIDDLTDETTGAGPRPPEAAAPATRLFLRIFRGLETMSRDDLGKTLRGTGLAQADFEARGWAAVDKKTVLAVPIPERFAHFTAPGRTRKILKTDLDQAHFLVGAALPGSKLNIEKELDKATFKLKPSVDPILDWFAETAPQPDIRNAAQLAATLLARWRTKIATLPKDKQLTFLDELGVGE